MSRYISFCYRQISVVGGRPRLPTITLFVGFLAALGTRPTLWSESAKDILH
jgi:hypothetical protein